MDSTRNLKYSIRLLPPDRQKRKRQSPAALFFIPFNIIVSAAYAARVQVDIVNPPENKQEQASVAPCSCYAAYSFQFASSKVASLFFDHDIIVFIQRSVIDLHSG